MTLKRKIVLHMQEMTVTPSNPTLSQEKKKEHFPARGSWKKQGI